MSLFFLLVFDCLALFVEFDADAMYSWVQTDMGAMGAKEAGIESPPTTLEDSVAGLIDKVCGFDSHQELVFWTLTSLSD